MNYTLPDTLASNFGKRGCLKRYQSTIRGWALLVEYEGVQYVLHLNPIPDVVDFKTIERMVDNG